MTAAAPHLILAGGGLANGLIALRMREAHPEVPITVIEAGPVAGGNHTWSFHQGDLSAEQHRFIEPLVRHRWPAQEVRFPAYARRMNSAYLSIPSSALAERIAEAPGIELRTGVQATSVARRHIETDAGERIEGSAVIDARGPDRTDGLLLGFQKFLGLEVRTTQPHGVERPVIMDATVSQADGYRFVYLLPFSDDTLLIEDTRYSDGHALSHAELTAAIEVYAEKHGWEIAETLREENGVLPILLAGDFERFWPDDADAPARAGLRAGLFHPTTGYSLPQALSLADAIAANWPMDGDQLAAFTRQFVRRYWDDTRLFRLLNRMLFKAGQADKRYLVMQRFYRLSESLITNFYASRLTLGQKARILTGKPPVPFFKALTLLPERPFLPRE